MNHNEIPKLTERKRNLIFINLVVSGIASSILSTAMTTALPNVVEYFGVSTSTGQWVTSGYSLVMGMAAGSPVLLAISIFGVRNRVADHDR